MQADVEAIMRACDMDPDCPFKGMAWTIIIIIIIYLLPSKRRVQW